MTKICSTTKDIINVYRSSGTSSITFLDDLKDLFDDNRETWVIGDFNICFHSEKDHLIFKTLASLDFKQLVMYPTHIEGRLIDLVFHFSPQSLDLYDVKQQSPYFTDHDVLYVQNKKVK